MDDDAERGGGLSRRSDSSFWSPTREDEVLMRKPRSRGWHRLLPVVLLLWLFYAFLAPAAWAEPAGWTPATVVPGAWEQTEQRVELHSLSVGTNSRSFGEVRTCAPVRSTWEERREGLVVSLVTIACPDERAAAQARTVLSTGFASIDSPPALDGRADWVFVTKRTDGVLYGHLWGQGNLAFIVRARCAGLAEADCLELSGRMTVSVSKAFPGNPLSSNGLFMLEMVNFGLASLALPWVLWIGLTGLAAIGARDKFALPRGMVNFVDVLSLSRSLRTRSFFYGLVVGVRRVAVVLTLIGGGSQLVSFTVPGMLLAGSFAALAVALTFACRKLDSPLYHGVVNATTKRLTWRMLIALLLRGTVRVLVVVALLIYLEACLSAALGGPRGMLMGRALAGYAVKISFGTADVFDYFRFAGIFASGDGWLVGYFVVGFLTLMLLFDRLALAIQTRDAREVLKQDRRPPILYLRNFGDDKLKVRASRVSRRGLLGRLSLTRKRKFEETIAWRINVFANVVAVSDPRSSLRTLGAAKMNLAHDNWKDEVESIAAASFAVLVSATPVAINDGLRWELEMIATRLRHGRVVLLLAPRGGRELIHSWRLFLDAVRGYPFFAGIHDINPTGAAQVITHVPGVGWRAWGAKVRTEWTYTVAVDAALREMRGTAGR